MDAAKYKTLPFRYKLARFCLLLRNAYPFLGEVCMRVEKYSKDMRCLASTDGRRIYLNEIRMNELLEESFNFVLLHELFHILLWHRYPKDAQFYEKIYWNISFDLIVNWLILGMEFELRQHGLPILPISDTFLCLDDLSDDPSHRIANAFVQQAIQQGILSDSPPVFVVIKWKTFEATIANTADIVFDVLDADGADNAQSSSYMRELLASCMKAAGNEGLPWRLQGLMDELVNGRKLPWFIILKRYIEASMSPEEFDFCPPDKRMLYCGMLLPASNMDDKALNNALIVLDVSSSVSRAELAAQIWQIKTVLSDLEFSGSILSFGSEVYQETLLTNRESLEKFIGDLNVGGGTDWAKVVKHIREKHPRTKPIIVFTDGYFYSFDTGLKNVIFVVMGKAPGALSSLGKVIEV